MSINIFGTGIAILRKNKKRENEPILLIMYGRKEVTKNFGDFISRRKRMGHSCNQPVGRTFLSGVISGQTGMSVLLLLNNKEDDTKINCQELTYRNDT